MPARQPRLPIPARPRSGGPGATIRMRLTALYGSVFLISSAGLLTVAYIVVRDNLRDHHDLHQRALEKLGLHPVGGEPFSFPPGSPDAQLVHTVQNQLVAAILHRLLIEYIVSLVAITAVAMLVGWLLAGRALAPLRAITATAQRVSGETLGERIGLTGRPDELKQLADTFDGMLERLDAAFASQKRFVSSASHELRTPLAIMRTELDVALADPDASAAELRATGEAMIETIDRCERLITSLLLLARSDGAPVHAQPVDLAVLAADCVTDLRARFREAAVVVETALEPAWTDADPGLLERLIANLVDNALHHNVADGTMRVVTGTAGSRVTVSVANGGAVIDPAVLPSLTEPFRRLRRGGTGFGLGLSIVRAIADAHHGTVTFAAPAQGGLFVQVSLPALPGHAPAAKRARVAETRSEDPQVGLTES